NDPPPKGLKSWVFSALVLQIAQNHGKGFCKCAPDIGGTAFVVQSHLTTLSRAWPAAATCIWSRNRMQRSTIWRDMPISLAIWSTSWPWARRIRMPAPRSPWMLSDRPLLASRRIVNPLSEVPERCPPGRLSFNRSWEKRLSAPASSLRGWQVSMQLGALNSFQTLPSAREQLAIAFLFRPGLVVLSEPRRFSTDCLRLLQGHGGDGLGLAAWRGCIRVERGLFGVLSFFCWLLCRNRGRPNVLVRY